MNGVRQVDCGAFASPQRWLFSGMVNSLRYQIDNQARAVQIIRFVYGNEAITLIEVRYMLPYLDVIVSYLSRYRCACIALLALLRLPLASPLSVRPPHRK